MSKNKKINLLILVAIILIYFIFKLPFNLSVEYSSLNEGPRLAIGHFLLQGEFFKSYAKPLLIVVYALIVKIFGFGTWSIIAIHFIQTFVSILIAILVYLITLKLYKNYSIANVASLIFLLLLNTPIGAWSGYYELGDHYALEAEYFCILLSLLSIYLILASFSKLKYSILLAFISGIMCVISLFFKGSGTVLLISFLLWIPYTSTQRKLIKAYKANLIALIVSMVITILLAICFIASIIDSNIIIFFKDLFYPGLYTTQHLISTKGFFENLLSFMFRGDFSYKGLNNFIVTSIVIFAITWSILNRPKDNTKKIRNLFEKLIAIWTLGNLCAILAPGSYASYYYLLLYPGASILIATLLAKLIASRTKAMYLAKNLFLPILILILVQRIYLLYPTYKIKIKESINSNLFLQKQSFQDPVIIDTEVPSRRPFILQIADYINSFLPNKDDRIYILNFIPGHIIFSSNIYTYIKRLPPTTITADLLHQNIYLKEKINILKEDLTKSPPEIILKPKKIYLEPYLETNHKEQLLSLFEWLDNLLGKNYRSIDEFNCTFIDEKITQTFEVYKKVNNISTRR